jgi:ABC-2 type transport system ATP-binding protein
MSGPALPTRLDGAELAIETRSLVKSFDGTDALRELDLQVPAGAVYVLAGPNGSGKSTAIKVLLDLVRADHGTARVLGIETTANPALARAQIGYVPEKSETGYDWVKVERFLRHHAAFFETWDPNYSALLCRRLKVPLGADLRSLSKGALRSVILVTALAHRPPVLLLDEPTDGLDPLKREELMALLADHMADSPTTLLWCTHHVSEVERMADHVGVLRDGRLVLQAPRDEVRLRLRRYRAGVPEGWTGAPGLNGNVVLREGEGREVALTVWGEEREVAERLAAAGATVHDVAPLSLEQATVALLRAGATE